jgi:hypothetical protein
MSGMPAALKAAVIADCKTATERVTKPLPWQPKYSAVASTASYDPVKMQVSEICTGIEIGTARARAKQQREELINTTCALCSDLRQYGADIRLRPSLSRTLRHRLTDPVETTTKYIDETGFNTIGEMVEPPQQQWSRPQAMILYSRLVVGTPGRHTINDLNIEELWNLLWMLQNDLAEIDEDDRIWLLSDEALPDERRYPGFLMDDKRASIGRTHTAEDVQDFVMQVWNMIVDGHPPMDIGGEYRQEMTTKRGLRMSGRMMTYQCNKLLVARIDANCNCLGRDLVEHWWDLPDHGTGCAGRERGLSVDVVRRAIRELMKAGELDRTDEAILTRRNHTVHRVPAAYAIPSDAGWHRYVTQRRTRHPKPKSALEKRLEKRLLGEVQAPRPPAPYPLEYQDSVWDIEEAAS